jgi:hypothetical protein
MILKLPKAKSRWLFESSIFRRDSLYRAVYFSIISRWEDKTLPKNLLKDSLDNMKADMTFPSKWALRLPMGTTLRKI